jgi:hypothetical protein
MSNFKTLCTIVSQYIHMLYLNLYMIRIYQHTIVHNV